MHRNTHRPCYMSKLTYNITWITLAQNDCDRECGPLLAVYCSLLMDSVLCCMVFVDLNTMQCIFRAPLCSIMVPYRPWCSFPVAKWLLYTLRTYFLLSLLYTMYTQTKCLCVVVIYTRCTLVKSPDQLSLLSVYL